MRNRDDQKTTATNADLLLIMRNVEDQKATATNADLLLIMRNPADLLYFQLCETLKTKKQQ